MISFKTTKKIILLLFLGLGSMYFYKYLIEQQVIIQQEKTNLLNIYDIIKHDWVTLQKVNSIDISSFYHKYRLFIMKYKYSLNNEIAELLYKFHLFNNADIGDILDTSLNFKKNVVEKKNWFDNTEKDKQKLRIVSLLYICCMALVIFFSPGPDDKDDEISEIDEDSFDSWE